MLSCVSMDAARSTVERSVFSSRSAWTVCTLLLAVVGQVADRRVPDAGPVALRFHHLHYRVPDPGLALGQTVEQLKGSRTILQGLGVGVRIGREYVLFDRDEDDSGATAASAPRVPNPSQVYAEAVRWLTLQGVAVEPQSLADTAVAVAPDAATLDHVAFAADDPKVAIAALKEAPISVTDEAARFRLPSGLVVEVVRDTDRPDLYWCPMHPDVRKPVEGKCPRCSMALVPIPPSRIGEYRLDVTMTSPRSRRGVSGMTFVVRDPETGDSVSNFVDVHERPLHIFIVSRDLATFAHVHPQRREDNSFELRYELPPGEYMLIADFLPAGATAQLVNRVIVTPGYSGLLFAPPPTLTPGSTEQVVGGLRIRLEAPSLKPRRETPVRFQISDAATGSPVTDLEPYLGASGHLLIVSQDATAAIHAHPEGAATGGPMVAFDPVFPAPGLYKLWVQVQRKGEVVTASFIVDVP
jgi:hypothetical protein